MHQHPLFFLEVCYWLKFCIVLKAVSICSNYGSVTLLELP